MMGLLPTRSNKLPIPFTRIPSIRLWEWGSYPQEVRRNAIDWDVSWAQAWQQHWSLLALWNFAISSAKPLRSLRHPNKLCNLRTSGSRYPWYEICQTLEFWQVGPLHCFAQIWFFIEFQEHWRWPRKVSVVQWKQAKHGKATGCAKHNLKTAVLRSKRHSLDLSVTNIFEQIMVKCSVLRGQEFSRPGCPQDIFFQSDNTRGQRNNDSLYWSELQHLPRALSAKFTVTFSKKHSCHRCHRCHRCPKGQAQADP